MKLIFKGKYKNEDQLPKGELPFNAVVFKEPGTPKELNKHITLYLIIALAAMAVVVGLSSILHGEYQVDIMLTGLLLSFLTIFPHELLHGLCFPKNANVEMYYSLKNMMAFVVSVEPISKRRFIWMSLCPNLIFGWIPLLLWAILPQVSYASDLLFSFSFATISFGAGDYMNVINAIRQMPKGSIQQLSGFHSYWYMPSEAEENISDKMIG